MKEKNNLLPLILLSVSSFLPVLTLILYCFGYSITLLSYPVFSVISALIFIISTALISKSELFNCKKALRFFIALLPLISLINASVYVFKSKSAVVLVCMAVCFVCSAIIAEKICQSSKAKVASVITSALFSVPALILGLAIVAFSDFGVNTVIDRINSPNETYYAEIVDSDQGALGGDTVVYVHKTNKLNLLILTINKNPQRVYLGDWKEYEKMRIEWKNEQCLLIDSKKYTVNI